MKIRNSILLLTFAAALCFIFGSYSIAKAESKFYRVFFTDKGSGEFSVGSALYDSAKKFVTQRAIDRRKKVRPLDSLLTIEDAPVYAPYLDSLIAQQARILQLLRWRNYVVIKCETDRIESIKAFSFVKFVQPTTSKAQVFSDLASSSIAAENLIKTQSIGNCGRMDYGNSLLQSQILNIIPLHEIGIMGQGVVIGFIDVGYRWKFLSCLKNANVLAEYDFINGDTITSNEIFDSEEEDHHGTLVLSTVAGFSQGNLIGVAPASSFLLAKTENYISETRIEEDNYAAGVEWEEAKGADIITSSLGYINYDSTEENYVYSDLDGKSTTATRAVNRAFSLGVVCITAAGNNGSSDSTISTPGDADSVLTIGSVDVSGLVSSFSSRGPRADGAIKPNLVCLGRNVVATDALADNTFIQSTGTSAATPQIAGACALLLSQFPELTPRQVWQQLYSSASNQFEPNKDIGYGIPNIYQAMTNYGLVIAPPANFSDNQFQRVITHIISKYPTITARLYAKFSDGLGYRTINFFTTSNDNQYVADIPLSFFNNDTAQCYIIANDGVQTRRFPFDENETFIVVRNETNIPCGIDETLLPKVASGITKAFIYPSIASNSIAEVFLTLTLTVPATVRYEIYNSIGQVINTAEFPLREQGIATYPINIQNYAAGAYYLRLDYNGQTEVVSFIKN